MTEPALTPNARRIFDARYARKDADGNPTETPAEAIARVAINVASVTSLYSEGEASLHPDDVDTSKFPWRTPMRQLNWMREQGILPSVEQVSDEYIISRSWEEVERQAAAYADMISRWEFLPNSPTWTGAGTPLQQLSACFVLPIDDDLGRTRRSIFGTMNNAALIQQTGGGNGFSFGKLRPKDSTIKASMGKASGPVSFMRVYDAAFKTLSQGGSRRGANMGILPISHPDVMEFIRAKVVEGEIEGFNISVALTDDFMAAVAADGPFDLEFGGTVYETVQARDLFDEITSAAWRLGDPGCVFIDRANRDNPCPTRYTLESTNPCLSPDTLIAVADGRGAVSIKELADQGEDVPVYTFNRETGEVEVSLGINPRVTGYDQELFRVSLNNGTSFDVTGGHKFILKNGGQREAKDLVEGDSLQAFSRWASAYNRTNNRYWFASCGIRTKFSEHRLIANFLLGKGHGKVVHHADFDGLNNRLENLIPLTDEEHREVHDFSGSKNPMFGRTHSEETKKKIGLKSLGRKHNLGKVRSDEHKAAVSRAQRAIGDARKVTRDCEWCGVEMILPHSRREQGFCSRRCLSFHLAHDEVVEKLRIETRNKTRQEKSERQVEVFLDLQSELGRDPFKKEWEERCNDLGVPRRFAPPSAIHTGTFRGFKQLKEAALVHNHRVVSVEKIGRSDVYNMTVQDHHNYAIVDHVPRRGKPIEGVETSLSGVFTTQCGEQFLSDYESCCLGSIAVNRFVLGHYLDPNGVGFDWDRFAQVIHLAQNFLDDVIDANGYVAGVPELATAAMNGRRIGLGVMGLADAMLSLGLPYGSGEATSFGSQLMEFVRFHTMAASIERARQRGPFGWIENSIYDPELHTRFGEGARIEVDGVEFSLWQRPDPQVTHLPQVAFDRPELDWDIIAEGLANHGIRNSCQQTIAPTGTISNVAMLEGSGCEPLFALSYVRTMMQEEERVYLDYLSPSFETALELAGVDEHGRADILARVKANGGSCQGVPGVPEAVERVFVVAADVAPKDHVWTQAALQAFVSNAISKTINFPNSATIADVAEVYSMAHDLGCKGITIYRQGSRDIEVLSTTPAVSTAVEPQEVLTVDPWPTAAPMPIPASAAEYGLAARVYPLSTFVGKLHCTVTHLDGYPERPFDVRLQLGKAGNDTNAHVEALGRMISLSLRLGGSVSDVVHQLEGIGGVTSSGFGPNRVRSAADAVAKLLRRQYLAEDFPMYADPVGSMTITSEQVTTTTYIDEGIAAPVAPVATAVRPMVTADSLCPECGNATLVMEEGCKKCSMAMGGCGLYSGCD